MKTQFAYTPPASAAGQRCAALCESNAGLCEKLCAQTQESCLAKAKAQAQFDYEVYVEKRERKGKPVNMKLSQFDNSYRCYKIVSCNNQCVSDFNRCYQGCGGQVSSQDVCTAFCD